MKIWKRTAFFLALAFPSFGCAHLAPATAKVSEAQRFVAGVKPQVEQVVKAYDRKVDQRLKQCEAQEPLTEEARRQCLGHLSPDSILSRNIAQLRKVYDYAADDLQTLLFILEIIERYPDLLELEELNEK